MLRQVFEEAIQTHAYQYIAESLDPDESEIFVVRKVVTCIWEEDDLLILSGGTVTNPPVATQTPAPVAGCKIPHSEHT